MDGDRDLALACWYEALELTENAVDRERILTNIALAFAQMGLRKAARDAALIVVATAQDRSTRLTALVNLMEVAHQDGRELVFEQYRRDLAHEELTPYLQAVDFETCAEGLHAFRRASEARHVAQWMLDLAERHDLNEFVLKAETLLHAVEVAPETHPPRQVESAAPSGAAWARAVSVGPAGPVTGLAQAASDDDAWSAPPRLA